VVIEGIEYEIDWAAFKRGTSFFIPCVDTDKAKQKVQTVLRRIGMRAAYRRSFEDGIVGLRVWRT